MFRCLKFARPLAVLAAMSISVPAAALTSVSPTDLSGLASSDVTSMLQTVGIVADHHAYMPATSMGLLLGVDVGIDTTYLSLPAAFASALALASGQSTAQLPAGLVLPKLNVHKGLPFRLDVGASFMTLSSGGQTVLTSYGGDLKYSFIKNVLLPAVAARVSYSSNTVYFIKSSTFTIDLVASKNLILFDPYIGAGMQFWSGSLSVPSSIPQLTSGVSSSASGSSPRFYAGVLLKLLILRIDGEMDYSTAGITTFGGKLSLGF